MWKVTTKSEEYFFCNQNLKNSTLEGGENKKWGLYFLATKIKKFKYPWRRCRVTIKPEDYIFWNQNKKIVRGRWKETKQMWIILFWNISPLSPFTFIKSTTFYFGSINLWHKYNPHFLLSTITSLKSIFILVPKKYNPHFLFVTFHLPKDYYFLFWFQKNICNTHLLLSPFTFL